jgi:hypothetical protein
VYECNCCLLILFPLSALSIGKFLYIKYQRNICFYILIARDLSFKNIIVMFILYLLFSTRHVTLNLIECLAELWLVSRQWSDVYA